MSKWLASSLLCSQILIGTAACSDVGAIDASIVDTAEQPIIGGSNLNWNYFSVAAYGYLRRKADGIEGYTTLGSGVYLGTVDGIAIVSTARHVVDNYASVDGLIHPREADWFRMTTDLNPGRPWDSPPSIGAPPHLMSGYWIGLDEWTNNPEADIASIFVLDTPDFSSGLTRLSSVGQLPGLAFNDPSTLAGASLTAYGYGVNVAGLPSDQMVYNTGTLKSVGGLSYRSTTSGGSTFILNRSSSGYYFSGDSGGAITNHHVYPLGSKTYGWLILAGSVVGAAPNDGLLAAQGRYIAAMIQSHIGYLYLSPMYLPEYFAEIRNGSAGLNSVGGGWDSRLFYNPTTKQLQSQSGYCLKALTGVASGTACDVNSARQRWTHTGSLQLKSVATGQCVAVGGHGETTLTTCSANASQAWVFHVGMRGN